MEVWDQSHIWSVSVRSKEIEKTAVLFLSKKEAGTQTHLGISKMFMRRFNSADEPCTTKKVSDPNQLLFLRRDAGQECQSPPIVEAGIYWLLELLVLFYRTLPVALLFRLNLELLKLKSDWLYRALDARCIAVNLAKKSWRKNPPRRHFQKNLSILRLPPRPSEDLAGFDPGSSVTGIRAEAFHKKAHPLGYCASCPISPINRKP